MYIPGVQLLDRFYTEVKFLITPRTGVTSFNFYQSIVDVGPYVFFAAISNSPNLSYPYKGKILLQFDCTNWDNTIKNFVTVAAVIGGIEQPAEGPMIIPPIRDRIIDKSENILGYNKDEKRFINVAVNTLGEVILN